MNMKLSDVSKIEVADLKNLLHPAKLQELLNQRPEFLVNAGIIVVTIFIVFFTFSNRHHELQSLKTKIIELEEKRNAIKTQKDIDDVLVSFAKSFPQTTTSENLINYITELAAPKNIEINSMSPAKKVTKVLYDTTTMQMQITSKDYKDLARFIYDIEHSPYALRIEQFTASLATQSNARRSRNPIPEKTESELNLKIGMRLGTVELIK